MPAGLEYVHICTISAPLGVVDGAAASYGAVARSIYVPLLPEELDLLVAMARQDHRSPHDQGAYLITQALNRWRAERALEASLRGESTALEDIVA